MGKDEKKIDFKRMNFHYAFNVAYYERLFQIMYTKDDLQTDTESQIACLNENLLHNQPKPQQELNNFDSDMNSFSLKTGYPGLLIGIGNQHESKLEDAKGEIVLGLCLDYVTGMPYIPGSSVKGLIRSVFKQLREEYPEYIVDMIKDTDTQKNYDGQFLENAEKHIFDGMKNGVPIPVSERDIFFDAQIVEGLEGKIILKDNIAPHHAIGDDKKDVKQKYAEPNPINFIKVGPEVKFQFRFHLKDSEISSDNEDISFTVQQKIDLFKNILMDFGIGAKTNVGYGVLDE